MTHQNQPTGPYTGIVYKIRCLANSRLYVGCTQQDPEARWKQHKSFLRHGKHFSKLLQSDWDQLGEDQFVFETLQLEYGNEPILQLEQKWIGLLEPEYNHNGPRVLSAEARANMSRGAKLRAKPKRKVGNHANRLSEEQKHQIKDAPGSVAEIAKQLGVSERTVWRYRRNQESI